MSELNKKEFIQQFVIHTAGPMLAIVDDHGRQRFEESDIISLAESFANKTCEGLVLSDFGLNRLTSGICKGNEALSKAIEEYQTANRFKIVINELHLALEHYKQILEWLAIYEDLQTAQEEKNSY